MDLSGLGGFGSGMSAGYMQGQEAVQQQQLRQQQIQRLAFEQQQQQRAQQSQGAYFRSLTSPQAGSEYGAMPSQGPLPPGMGPPQPGGPGGPPQQPGMMPPGGQGMPPAPPGGPQAGPGPAGMPMQPPPQQQAPAGPPGAPGMEAGRSPMQGPGGQQLTVPDPVGRLRSMAAQIKSANPGMDDATLAMALEQTVAAARGIGGEDKALLQAETQIMKIQAQSEQQIQRAQSAREVAQIRAEAATAVAQQRVDAANMLMSRRDETQRRGQDMRYGSSIEQEDVDTLAEAWAAGDRSAVAGLAPGDRKAVLARAAQMARGDSGGGRDLAANKVGLAGDMAGARTAAQSGARTDLGAREIQQFAEPLIAASRAVDRTKYPNINSMVLAAQKGTGDTNVVKFLSQLQAMKNAYSQVAARGGQTTDMGRKQADEVLDKAWSQGQIEAGIQQLQIEAAAVLRATEETGAGITDRIRAGRGKHQGGGPAAPAPDGPQPGSIINGYRFKGGDPNDRASYERVDGGGGPSDEGDSGARPARDRVTVTPEMEQWSRRRPIAPSSTAPDRRLKDLQQAQRGAGARDAR